MLGVMLGVCLGLGGGRRWEQPGAARSSPGAAESSPEQPGELWNSSGRAQGDPGHLENDTFGSEPWGANFRLKPTLGHQKPIKSVPKLRVFVFSRQRASLMAIVIIMRSHQGM